MPVRNESELLYARFDHKPYDGVSVGGDVFSSLDGYRYPTKIILTPAGEFLLEHFSQFEPGHEGAPNTLVRYFKDKEGNLKEEVLGGFQRKNSKTRGHLEYDFISGQKINRLSKFGLSEDQIARGFVGTISAKTDQDIWRYIALILTRNEEYQDSAVSVSADLSLIEFLTNEILQHGVVVSITSIPEVQESAQVQVA